MKYSRLIFQVAITICIIFAITMCRQQAIKAADEDIIYTDVSIEGTDVGGLSYEEAYAVCEQWVESMSAVIVSFECRGNMIEHPLYELGLTADINAALEEAYQYGRKGNVLKRYREMNSPDEHNEIDIMISIDRNMVTQIVDYDFDFCNVEPVSATLMIEDDIPVITPEVKGVTVCVDETVELLCNEVTSMEACDDIQLQVVTSEITPAINSEILNVVTSKLGTYSTNYSGDAGRMNNVENAASKLNGVLLLPGEGLSVTELIAPFTLENGYEYAGAYTAGKVVSDIGGGVCQVSTTLYNALIRAEVEVTERYNHSMTVGYVSLSEDAAIAEGLKDLKFFNNLDSPIYICAECTGGTITFSIYGNETRPQNRTIEFESITTSVVEPGEAVETENPDLVPGERRTTQRPKNGYTAELWKHVYVDGVETETFRVNSSTYIATPEYIDVGPSTVAPAESTDSPDVPTV